MCEHDPARFGHYSTRDLKCVCRVRERLRGLTGGLRREVADASHRSRELLLGVRGIANRSALLQ